MSKDNVFSVGDRARLGNSVVNIEQPVKLIGMPQAYVVTNNGNMSLVFEENLQQIYIPEDGQKFRVEKWPAMILRCVETNSKAICYEVISDELSPAEVGYYDSFPLWAHTMIPVDDEYDDAAPAVGDRVRPLDIIRLDSGNLDVVAGLLHRGDGGKVIAISRHGVKREILRSKITEIVGRVPAVGLTITDEVTGKRMVVTGHCPNPFHVIVDNHGATETIDMSNGRHADYTVLGEQAALAPEAKSFDLVRMFDIVRLPSGTKCIISGVVDDGKRRKVLITGEAGIQTDLSPATQVEIIGRLPQVGETIEFLDGRKVSVVDYCGNPFRIMGKLNGHPVVVDLYKDREDFKIS